MAAARAVSLADTRRLGKDLLTSRSNVNNVPLLLSILVSDSPAPASKPSTSATECRLEALRSLQAFFSPLLGSGKFSAPARKRAELDIDAGEECEVGGGSASAAHAEAVYRLWVWNKYREFKRSLFRIVAKFTNAQVLQVATIHTIMDLVREEKSGEFNNSLYFKLCGQMVGSKGQSNEILQVMITKYFKYRDVRYFTYSNLEKLTVKRIEGKQIGHEMVFSDEDNNEGLGGVSLHTFVRNVYDVLLHLPPPSKVECKDADAADELWSNSLGGGQDCEKIKAEKGGQKSKKMDTRSDAQDVLGMGKYVKKEKSVMSKAWLSFLQLSLPLDVYKKVLARLHRNVIPYMTNPILLSDFLTQSYNTGGLISVMALGSLFILITKYGLEYPDFYNKLYALLEPSIFVARYRSRFFELLDTCLHSSHLPGYLGAAFAKRLGRLVLSAPPSGAIVVIALIHNLLRRHPSINVLVHQANSSPVTTAEADSENDRGVGMPNLEEGIPGRILEGRLGTDPFIASEPDTTKCNALKSSLWEIETLRRHYCPAVSRFVESLETDLTVRARTTEVAIQDFSCASYATIFEEEVGRRLKTVPLAFYSTVPDTLFPEHKSEGSFDGWRFEASTFLKTETLKAMTVTGDEGKGKLVEVNNRIEERGIGNSRNDTNSDEVSSGGSDDSRSRSEQSEGDDWAQPLLKRLRTT